MRHYKLQDNLIVFESALYRTTSTLLRAGGIQLLVDPNWLPEEVAFIRAEVERCGEPLYLLFTHSDYDHIIGYGAFSEATVLAGHRFVARPDRDSEVEKLRDWDDRHYIGRSYTLVYPKVDLIARGEGQPLRLGELEVLTWPAPGHTADGILTYVPAENLLLVGDYLSNLEFPFIYHSAEEYRRTLDRLEGIIRQYRPRLLVPGHGDVATTLEEMQHRLARDRRYLNDLEILAGRAGGEPRERDWPARYPFPRGLREEHTENVRRRRTGEV